MIIFLQCIIFEWISYSEWPLYVDSYQSKTEIQHWMPMKGIYPSHQYIWGPPKHCQLFQYSSKLIKLPWPKRIFSNYFHNQLHTSHLLPRHWVEIWSILELFQYYLCLHTNLLGIPGSKQNWLDFILVPSSNNHQALGFDFKTLGIISENKVFNFEN